MATSILLQNRIDKEKVDDGVWCIPKSAKELEVLIRRAGNVDARRLQQKLMRRHRVGQGRNLLDTQIDPEILDEINLEVTCKTLFVGFRGPAAIDEQGNELKDSYDNRVLILQANDALHDEILDIANERDLFRSDQIETDSKNSSSSSKSNSKTET